MASRLICTECGQKMRKTTDGVHVYGGGKSPIVKLRCDKCDITRFEKREDIEAEESAEFPGGNVGCLLMVIAIVGIWLPWVPLAVGWKILLTLGVLLIVGLIDQASKHLEQQGNTTTLTPAATNPKAQENVSDETQGEETSLLCPNCGTFYESKMRQIAQQLIKKHGELMEVRCVSGNNPCHIELEFSDGNVVVVGDHSGELDISLMKAGYHGTGSECFYFFLTEARFHVTVKQVGNMTNGTFLRRDRSSGIVSLTHDRQPVIWGTIGKTDEVLMAGEALISSTGLGNLKPSDVEKMKEEGDIDGLINALNDDDMYIHKLALEELCKIGDPRVVEPLLSALKYGHDYYDKVDTRMPIVNGLVKVGGPAVEQLIDALKSGDWRVRWTAVLALGEVGDTRAVEALIDALKDTRRGVREFAVEALGKIGDIRAVGPLKEAFEKDVELRRTVSQTLKKLESCNSGQRPIDTTSAGVGTRSSPASQGIPKAT